MSNIQNHEHINVDDLSKDHPLVLAAIQAFNTQFDHEKRKNPDLTKDENTVSRILGVLTGNGHAWTVLSFVRVVILNSEKTEQKNHILESVRQVFDQYAMAIEQTKRVTLDQLNQVKSILPLLEDSQHLENFVQKLEQWPVFLAWAEIGSRFVEIRDAEAAVAELHKKMSKFRLAANVNLEPLEESGFNQPLQHLPSLTDMETAADYHQLDLPTFRNELLALTDKSQLPEIKDFLFQTYEVQLIFAIRDRIGAIEKLHRPTIMLETNE